MIDWLGLYLQEDLQLRDAEPQQVEFLAWYRREQWRQNEERRMALIVEMSFDGKDSEGDRMWKNWCFRYLCRRFHDMTRWEWVPSLAQLDERWLMNKELQPIAFGYLKMIRDTAVAFVRENHLEIRKGVDY